MNVARFAAVAFSKAPNSSEAVFEIHRESHGLREMWVAKLFRTISLPIPDELRSLPREIPLRFLSPKNPEDPSEYEDSRGIEKALVDLWRALDADSGSLYQVQTNWWVNFDINAFCAELASRPINVQDRWSQLKDRLLEDDEASFVADVDEGVRSTVFAIPGATRLSDDEIEMSWASVLDVPIPTGVSERTGITVNRKHWVMLVGNPTDVMPVSFSISWVSLEGGVSEPRFIPDVPLRSDDGERRGDREVWAGLSPAGNTLIFTQSHAGDVGSVRCEAALLPRPAHEDFWE